MADSYKLFLQILGNATGLKNELKGSKNAVKSFTNDAKRDFASLRNTLAGIGISVGAISLIASSAKLDKSLMQIGQTAGASKPQIAALRSELFSMAKDTGQEVESLKEGFNSLIQSGLNMKEAKATLEGINTAMAVTGADAQTLAAGLTVAAQAFQFDLSKPGQALELLDKMTVAGRLGNAELQNLSDIFGRIGVNAASAGMSFDKTLAFIETLSLVERQPERLATLADSTLRLFTNINYMKNAQKATGIKFFDEKGSRRDAMAVFADIKKQYDKLKTESQKSAFIGKAFGKTDLDTIKGIRTLLNSDMIIKSGQFARTVGGAAGTLKHDLKDAIDNSVDQVGRLKTALKEAADEFAKPINSTTKNIIGFLMDSRDKGGLGLEGKDMLKLGLSGAALTYLTAKLGGSIFSRKIGGGLAKKAGGGLLEGLGSTAVGVAEGLALQKATGVAPVFVTNWPANISGAGIPGMPDILKKKTDIGKGLSLDLETAQSKGTIAKSIAMGAGKVSLAGAAGYAAGTLIFNTLPEQIWGKGLSEKIADALYDAVHGTGKTSNQIMNPVFNITIDKQGRPIVDSKGGKPAKVNVFNRGDFLPGIGGM